MARFRIWLRSRVRGLRRISKLKSRQQEQRKNEAPEIYLPLKGLKISTPVLVNQDNVNSKPLPPPPFASTISPRIEPPTHRPTNIIISAYKESNIEDTHSISAPSTLIEDVPAAPSLCEDSDEDDTLSEHLWPVTPTSPTRFGRRMSFLQILNANADGHYDPIMSRPLSFASSTPSTAQEVNRASHYSVLSDRDSKYDREANRTSHYSVLCDRHDKRASVVSQSGKRISVQSFNGRRRASVSVAQNRLSGAEWDESRASQRFSRRMSWGFETFSTHTSAYVPVRI
ncbi:hypothetical protein HBI56_157150 [Parastagonospora nodorum]|nr:hypothetical protein HBH56_063920 [Parastagonospora nodorum]QRC92191.1 hypothetical protein JI435_023380 [Parastagonospora nodorum SN15]KAH3930760.1 hypothetical protein HBH54_107860 [Parastagonospora nodorum]KAH3954292.1 hypothetical protein HBH53_022950 [Parastagonospora nodorum]KAH3967959.1 hypothetical protein HBH52_185390 [Parastagonospora nodorum]